MDDDFNVSAAWGAIFEWVRETNRQMAENHISPARANTLSGAWAQINQVLGLYTKQEREMGEKLDQALQKFLEDRAAARQAKDFKRSDAIRDELKAKGWVIEDTPSGQRLKRL